jgi:hypothetical protein
MTKAGRRGCTRAGLGIQRTDAASESTTRQEREKERARGRVFVSAPSDFSSPSLCHRATASCCFVLKLTYLDVLKHGLSHGVENRGMFMHMCVGVDGDCAPWRRSWVAHSLPALSLLDTAPHRHAPPHAIWPRSCVVAALARGGASPTLCSVTRSLVYGTPTAHAAYTCSPWLTVISTRKARGRHASA